MTEITQRECKFAIHVPTRNPNQQSDVHVIKERLTYDDGTSRPNLRIIKNFKRPFFITKARYRNHEQKKETEFIERCIEMRVTQSELRYAVAKALDKAWSKDSLKQLSTSPYLYGTDMSSTSLIKYEYQKKYPQATSAFSVCTFDIETDVVNGTELLIMATITYQNKCFTAILEDFVAGYSQVKEQLLAKARQYISEHLDKHGMTPVFYIAKDHVDLIKAVFNELHTWQPDFLAIWNMNFDIPHVLKALEHYGVDPREILCDPSLPKEYRICRYKQGPNKKVTASGRVIPISPASQWHTLFLTASFYVIDAMCAYKQIRLADQEETSYALDAILQKRLGIRKLKFKEAEGYNGLKWHQFMQTQYKLEYIIYNIFDSLSMLELDGLTKDLTLTLPSYAGISDFSEFKSQPRKIADAFYHFCLDKGKVVGTVPPAEKKEEEEPDIPEEPSDEQDDITLSLSEWISTLPSHMVMPGLHLIEEDPYMATNIRTHVFDSDAVSAYPTCISIANVSKSTTKREIIKIGEIDEEVFRLQNINCLFGRVNALEYSVNMYQMPKPWEIER